MLLVAFVGVASLLVGMYLENEDSYFTPAQGAVLIAWMVSMIATACAAAWY